MSKYLDNHAHFLVLMLMVNCHVKSQKFYYILCSNILVCLQAFVKMVGANVNAMEEQVTQTEGELGTLPSAFKKILRTMSVPGFLNVRASLCTCKFVVLQCFLPLSLLIFNVFLYLQSLNKH